MEKGRRWEEGTEVGRRDSRGGRWRGMVEVGSRDGGGQGGEEGWRREVNGERLMEGGKGEWECGVRKAKGGR